MTVQTKKWIFIAIVVILINGVLLCLRYFPFWVSLTNIIAFFVGTLLGLKN